MITEQIKFVRRGADVRRYHTMVTLQQNTVGHHSFNVAMLAFLMTVARDMAPAAALPVVMAALSHDLAEQATGDMPSDAKRAMGLRATFGDYEDKLLMDSKLLFILTEEGEKIVKRADIFEGALFCCNEASLGNQRIGAVYANYREYIDEIAGEFNEAEQDLVNFIDDMWLRYTGEGRRAKEGALDELQQEGCDLVADASGRLINVLRREEAEGRATPPPLARDTLADPPSEQANLDGTPVAGAPASAPSDDVAQPELASESPSSPANARQVGGDHYKGVGYEHWDLVLDTGMNYFQGCATKYVTRWRRHEAGMLNLKKAIHYIEKLQEAWDKNRAKPDSSTYSVDDIITFGVANGLNDLEVQVIKDIVAWRLGAALDGLALLGLGETAPPAKGSRAYYGQND